MAKKKKPARKTKPQPKIPDWRQQIMAFMTAFKKSHLGRFGTLWLAAYIIAISFMLIGIQRSDNYIEIYPEELKFPLLMHGLIAIGIAVAFYWLPWIKSFAGKLLGVIVMALFIIGYDGNLQTIAGPIKAFVPGLASNDPIVIVSFIYLLILYALSILTGVGYEILRLKLKWLREVNIQLGLGVFVAWLFVVPAFSVGQMLPTLISESQVQAPTFTKPPGAMAVKDKPDIYYLVFDRYTNNDVLKKQFQYDNSLFTDFLRSNGYLVNDSAYSSYPATAISISSTMSANYTNELVKPFIDNPVQSRVLYDNLIWQSSVVKAFKNDGYAYYSVGNWYGTSNRAPLADQDFAWDRMITAFGQQIKLRDIEATEFTESPLRRFLEPSFSPIHFVERDKATQIRDQFNVLNDIITKEKPGGRFIFAHILLPHEPFQFNADGSFSEYQNDDNVGKPIKQKYVDQLQFTNTQIRDLVEKIKVQSQGKAVVIINADEGPYPQFLNETFIKPAMQTPNAAGDEPVSTDMLNWPTDWLQMKEGILQAVHIPLATQDDLNNLSSVNVFRIVLNRYLGYNLNYLPKCHFGFPGGNRTEYVYTDITARIEANPNPNCKNYATSP